MNTPGVHMPAQVATRLARIGASAEILLTEIGHPGDLWADLEVRPGHGDGQVLLLPRHGEESAVELIDHLECAGRDAHQRFGPIELVVAPELRCGGPWAPAPASHTMSLPWQAATAAVAAKTLLEDIAARRYLAPELMPILWLARAMSVSLDRRARLREAPRVAGPPRVGAVRMLR